MKYNHTLNKTSPTRHPSCRLKPYLLAIWTSKPQTQSLSSPQTSKTPNSLTKGLMKMWVCPRYKRLILCWADVIGYSTYPHLLCRWHKSEEGIGTVDIPGEKLCGSDYAQGCDVSEVMTHASLIAIFVQHTCCPPPPCLRSHTQPMPSAKPPSTPNTRAPYQNPNIQSPNPSNITPVASLPTDLTP